LLLDDPRMEAIWSGQTDGTLFYFDDDALLYRLQRDRYGVAYTSPFSGANLYIMAVGLTGDLRVRITGGVRDVAAGTWSLWRQDTTPFAYIAREPWTIPHPTLLSGVLYELPQPAPEYWTISHPSLLGGSLVLPIKNYTAEPEYWIITHPSLLGGSLVQPIKNYTAEPEYWIITHPSLLSGLLKPVVVSYTLENDPWTISHPSLLGGSLVIP
jgi:hypothetical protein